MSVHQTNSQSYITVIDNFVTFSLF